MKSKSDVDILKSVINFYSFAGIFPNMDKKRSVLIAFFFMLSFAGTIWLPKVYWNNRFILYKMSLVELIVYFGTITAYIVFNIVCLISLVLQRNLWKDLFKNIEEFDLAMEGHRINLEKNSLLCYLKIFSLNIVYLLLLSFIYFSVEGKYNQKQIVPFIFLSFLSTQLLMSTLVLKDLLKILEKRYDFLEFKMKEIYISSKNHQVFWNKHQFKTLHFLLSDMVGKINRIFGQKVLVILTLTIFNVLDIIEFSLEEYQQEDQKSIINISTVLLQGISLLVSIITNNYIY